MEEEPLRGQRPLILRLFTAFGQRYQSLLDAWTPHTTGRWIFSAILLIVYMARVIIGEGWYIVTYALGIYYLNLLIAFLTPKVDPAQGDDDLDDEMSLPTTRDEEFRPFIRRLPEFKFWHSATKATLIAMFCTFFEAFNIPVFWPILLVYFCTLFGITMKRQIKHMYKYKYLPWTRGKTRYQGKQDTGKVIQTK
ncbi:protein RER1-like isoform X2 [Panonychus citri]|uniref:protein RER1-like isoform X2 n=1 Tax=Panonychus citri TaxID=50023 RepID=UPI002307A2AC|nr:protein RER1-like isoform X2 [Panonychus citri]